MENQDILHFLAAFIDSSDLNYVHSEDAIYPHLAGMKFFEEPLVGFSSADDTLYCNEFKQPGILHPAHKTPEEWLPGAKSVISFFLPFTAQVRASNKLRHDLPYDPTLSNQHCSVEWLHARIEGQELIHVLSAEICLFLQRKGFRAIAPAISPEFRLVDTYVSNWSERHVAYASGLGTFSVSRALITEKGMAGRLGSVITDAEFEPTERPYESPFEYCIACGACQHRCPITAIDLKRGIKDAKNQDLCGPHVRGSILPPHGPNGIVRYGCGKCQVDVPCEHQNPLLVR